MHSSTLPNWDGRFKIDQGSTIGTANTNSNGRAPSVKVPVQEGSRDQQGENERKGTFKAMAQDASLTRDIEAPQHSVALASLFDEDIPVVHASPSKKRVASIPETPDNRCQSVNEDDDTPLTQLASFHVKVVRQHSLERAASTSAVISVYSKDAEGEDDTDNVEVDELPEPRSRREFSSSPLHSSDDLFSAPPSPAPPRKRRVVFVEPPVLSKEKRKCYESMAQIEARALSKHVTSSSRPTMAAKPQRPPAYQTHEDLAAAMNDVIQNNDNLSKETGTHNSAKKTNIDLTADSMEANDAVIKQKRHNPTKKGIQTHTDLTAAMNSSNQADNNGTIEAAVVKRKKLKAQSNYGFQTHLDLSAALNSAITNNHNSKPPNPKKPKPSSDVESTTAPKPGPSTPPGAPLPKRPPKRKKDDDAHPRAIKKPRPPSPEVESSYLLTTDYRYSELELWLNIRSLLPTTVDEKVLSLSREQTRRGDAWRSADREETSDCEYSMGRWWFGEFDESDDEEHDVDLPGPSQDRALTPEIPLPAESLVDKPPPTVDASPVALFVDSEHLDLPKSPLPLSLSQKALGKRREEPLEIRSPSRMNVGTDITDYLRPSTVPSASPPNPALNIYRNPSSDVLLSSLAPPAPEDRAEDQHSPFFTNPTADDMTSSYSMTTMDPPWGPPQEEYRFETINPTLLQQPEEFLSFNDGVAGNEGLLELEYPVPEESGGWNGDAHASSLDSTDLLALQQKGGNADGVQRVDSNFVADANAQDEQSSSLSSSSSSSSRSSSRSPCSILDKGKGKAVPAASPLATIRQPRAGTPSEFDLGNIPPYKSDSDDTDYEGSDSGTKAKLGRGKRKKIRKKFGWDTSDFEAQDDGPMRVGSSSAGTRRPAVKKGPPKKGAALTTGPPQNFAWATGEEEAYCHQCRRKSFKLKMTAPCCNAKYCNRCVAVRYPDIEFRTTFPSGICLRCEGVCNCDLCCRKRGETFQSSKVFGKAIRPSTTEPKPARDDGGRRAKPKPVAPSAPAVLRVPSGSVQTLGTIYGLDGTKMQVTFVNIDPQDVKSSEGGGYRDGASGSESDVQKGEEDFKSRRVFVGRIPRSWKMGTRVDIAPLESEEDLAQDEQEGVNGGSKKSRIYAGKPPEPPPPVPEPSAVSVQESSDSEEEDDDDDEDGGIINMDDLGHMFSSPLTSLPVSEEEDNVGGDDGKRFFSDSVQDNELARAVNLSFASLGLTPESFSPLTPNTPL